MAIITDFVEDVDVTEEEIVVVEESSGRRVSARIKNKVVKRKALIDEETERVVKKKRVKAKAAQVSFTRGAIPLRVHDPSTGSIETHFGESSNDLDVAVADVNGEIDQDDVADITGDEYVGKDCDLVAIAVVKETLRTFNKNYLQSVQEEESRCKKGEVTAPRSPSPKDLLAHSPSKSEASADFVCVEENKCMKENPMVLKPPKGPKHRKGPKPSSPSKSEGATTGVDKNSSKRPDLKALTKMYVSKTAINTEKRIGHIPGVYVGFQFFSRAEMCAVGAHSHWLSGIDYIGAGQQKKGKYKNYTLPLAVSVVVSGMYEDDVDNSDDIIYTGQGGNDLLGNKSQMADQKLERGNLALKNNLDQSLPVRVTRGHKCGTSYAGKIYTYDGLYQVVKHWVEYGVSKFIVHKYRLRRLGGQPALTTNQVQFTRKNAKEAIGELRGLVCTDISGGQERVPIHATNVVDDAPIAPMGFEYQKLMQIDESVTLSKRAGGCKCKGMCNPNTCACAKLNGDDFPYVRKDGGRLVEAKDVVYECGTYCGCGSDCLNRTSQQGLKFRLEVFRTQNKGWAVRSWDHIPAGAPVCEYRGKLMRTDDIDHTCGNSYIFDIDCEQTIRGLDGRERRLGEGVVPTSTDVDESDDNNNPEFCIDACSVGNIARFINHSCSPNLFVQCVLSDHHDFKQARIVLFASDNISPLQELTYDYGYALDSVLGPTGEIQRMDCHCGAAHCRKRLY